MANKTQRLLDSANKMLHRLSLLLMSLAILAILGAGAWLYFRIKGSTLSLTGSNAIDVTPTIIDNMKSIGQWEFLTINDEEIIDTVRTGFFSDDELVRIYYGTLRLGLDLSQCDEQWIRTTRDTVYVTLPPPRLLDYKFIDEARTTSFLGTGQWTHADRKAMYERARRQMMSRCITEQNIAIASNNARDQLQRLLTNVAAPRNIKIITEKE